MRILIFETLQQRNEETKKRRNEETKARRNEETKERRNEEAFIFVGIHNTYNMKSNNSLIDRLSMVNASWLMVQGSPDNASGPPAPFPNRPPPRVPGTQGGGW